MDQALSKGGKGKDGDSKGKGRGKGKGKGKGKTKDKEAPYPRDGMATAVGEFTKVFFHNVNWQTNEGYLRAQFEKIGAISDFDLYRKMVDRRSLGMGTVE